MRWMRVVAVAGLALLAGCGQPGVRDAPGPPGAEVPTAAAVAPAMDTGARTAPSDAGRDRAATGASFIAYSHEWAFELPARALLPTLAAHRRLCAEMGPARCQLLGSSQTRGEGDAIEARLELRVAPGDTASLGQQLESSVAAADGRTLSAQISGEDLTRQLIDAEAALRAKRALRDRLQGLLERREGKLAELLETEKALAETQAQLDAATALLAELRRRVDFSTVTIRSRSTRSLALDRGRPLADAWANASHTLSASLASLLTLLVAALPWALLVALGVWVARRWQQRRRPPAP